MIRLLQRRLIIPRGDTGSFTVPLLSQGNTDNIAVFTIFDELTRTRLFQKIIQCEGDVMNVVFTHNDTVNLKPGKYLWDIKFYQNPQFIDEELVNGDEVDSYYAGFSLPVCEIRETADNYLVSPDAPTAMLTPEQLDIITGAISSLNEAIEKTQSNVEHYPIVRNEIWYTWDAETQDYVSTGVRANGIVGPAGTGISSVVLNDDYTLTLNLTDGTSFTSTSIRGEVGNGIDDIVLNNDYTLTIRYTDGEVYTTPSIRGAVGATPQFSIGTVQDGAVAAATITGTAENPVLNLTLPNAHVPTRVSQLENDSGYLTTETDPTVPAWAKESTKPSYTPQEVGALPANTYIPQKTSDLTNDSNYAVDANYVHTDNNYTTAEKNKLNGIAAGAEVNVNADWNATSGGARILNKPTNVSAFENDAGYLTSFTETDPTVPAWAKAAQKPSYTAAEVGAPTVAEMNTAIGEAVGQINSFDLTIVQALPTQNISTHTIYLVPKTGETNDVYDEYVYINNGWEMIGNTQIDLSNYATKDELPDVPVQDVQVNGVSVLANGVANVPIASSSYGVVKVNTSGGIKMMSGYLTTMAATDNDIQTGLNYYRPIVPGNLHTATFYGLAKASGDTTQSQSSNTVSNYTDTAKEKIQSMLGISQMLAPENPNLVASQAYAIGDVFTTNGKLYKATAAIAADAAIITDGASANCEETNLISENIKDVQVNGTSMVANGVANIPIASSNNLGAVYTNTNYGIGTNSAGRLYTQKASSTQIKGGSQDFNPIVALNQHESAFYGLAKAAGDTTQSQSDNAVGTYTDEAKAAIKSMIGVNVEDVQMMGTSVLTDGVANIPIGTTTQYGVVRAGISYGAQSYGSGNSQVIGVLPATDAKVKAGTETYHPLVPSKQHQAVFYGLAKAAGDTTQSASSNAVGTYTDNAKASIKSMLGIIDGSTGTVDVSGAAPTIAAVENTRYVCGEVTSLDFTPAASGVCIVRFTSGSTPTLLTLPSTVKFPEWFDSTALETDTIYEMCITDGVYGAVMSWAL